MSKMDENKIKKIRLLRNKLMIVRCKVTKEVTGLYIPNIETQQIGSMGYLYHNAVIDREKYKKGTVVIFKQFAGYDVDEDHVAIDPRDVIAVVK